MKKLLIVATVSLLAGSVYGAVNQPNSLGDVKTNKQSWGHFTLVQINALTPDDTGQFVLCDDCTRSAVCVSSGADSGRVGAFVVPIESGTFAGATFSGHAHCQ